MATNVIFEVRGGNIVRTKNSFDIDPRCGLLYVVEDDDQLRHLLWKCDETDEVETDVIYLNETTVKVLPQTNNGRIIQIKPRCMEKRLQFWLEGPEDDDEVLCSNLQEALNGGVSSPPGTLSRKLTNSGSSGIPPQFKTSGLMDQFREAKQKLGTSRQCNMKKDFAEKSEIRKELTKLGDGELLDLIDLLSSDSSTGAVEAASAAPRSEQFAEANTTMSSASIPCIRVSDLRAALEHLIKINSDASDADAADDPNIP